MGFLNENEANFITLKRLNPLVIEGIIKKKS